MLAYRIDPIYSPTSSVNYCPFKNTWLDVSICLLNVTVCSFQICERLSRRLRFRERDCPERLPQSQCCRWELLRVIVFIHAAEHSFIITQKTMVCLSVCCSIILFIFMPLSVCLFVYCSIILFIFLSLSVCLSVCLFYHSFIFLSLFVCLFVCYIILFIFLSLFVCLFVCLSFFLSVVLSICRSFYLLFFLSVVLSIIISVIVCLSVSHLSIVLSVYISSVAHSARSKALYRASLYNLRQQHLHSTCFLRSLLPLVRKRWKIHKNQATHTQT